MSKEGVEALSEYIDAKIDYFRKEYEMTYAEVIGVLECTKFNLLNEDEEE